MLFWVNDGEDDRTMLGYCGNYILYLILSSSVYPRLFWVLGDRTITGMFWN